MRLYWIPVLSILLLTSCCGKQDVVPVVVVVPVPPPKPPQPPDPPQPPQPNTEFAQWADVESVVLGLTRAQVDVILHTRPKFDTDQGSGIILVEWASVDATGKPEYLDVTFTNGVVTGRTRIPRAPVPPPTPVAFTEGDHCENGACGLNK